MATLQQKLMVSLGSAALFVLVNLPQTYGLTDKLLGGLVGPLAKGGCPTTVGLLVHAVVFYLLSKLSMNRAPGSHEAKHRRALTATFVMALLSSPMAYKLVRNMLGSGIASATGCPTMQGILVHAAVYTGALVMLMHPRFAQLGL